jgi:hypothetical protein
VKGRFPPDLLVVILGPVVVVAIAIAFGSLIFHAQQLRGSVAGHGLILGVVALGGMLFFRRRRRH